ncbi:VOC family protein [Citricoccus nitrophenolicus]|uniref:VOC family protein n=1 Tax=Citricoccus nitrophenolicus TaxID=863575 RepID=UPI0031E96293
MRLENLNVDSLDPHRLAAFWTAALGAEPLTEDDDLAEIRVNLPEGRFLDLCFEQVPDPSPGKSRVHPDLTGGQRQEEIVEHLLGMGATAADIGQGNVPWVVLADPEGNSFCVMDKREAYRGTGVLTSLILEGDDPSRDADFWAVATGWERVQGVAEASLRHPSGTGPLLEFLTESGFKRGKNRMHLDVRPGPDDGAVTSRLRDLGAQLLTDNPDWPWSTWSDPSGNEFCILAPYA